MEGYRLKKSTLSPTTVVVRGARNVLENMRNVQTRPLNIAGFTGAASVNVELGPLPKFAFYLDQPSPRISVDVLVELVERRFANVRINTSGAPQNARLNRSRHHRAARPKSREAAGCAGADGRYRRRRAQGNGNDLYQAHPGHRFALGHRLRSHAARGRGDGRAAEPDGKRALRKP